MIANKKDIYIYISVSYMVVNFIVACSKNVCENVMYIYRIYYLFIILFSIYYSVYLIRARRSRKPCDKGKHFNLPYLGAAADYFRSECWSN